MNKLFLVLLLAVPLTFVADHLHWSPVWIMVIASVGIVPLAKYMGQSTEHIAHKTGPTIGGLLSATFGNACELILAFFALKAGLIDVVKASLTGSIMGNALLVMGASMLAGGLKHPEQRFNKDSATTAANALTIVALTLTLPAAMHYGTVQMSAGADTRMALVISTVLIVLYGLFLLFNLKTHKHLLTPVDTEEADDEVKTWSLPKSIAVLLSATLAVVFLSEHLVDCVDDAAKAWGMTPVFVGVVLLAIIGNAAENSSAILMARKNKMDLSLNIVMNSSTQIAMFVAPVLVLAGYFIGQPMDLQFTMPEIIAVVASVWVLKSMVEDGKSNWLEGAKLLGLYVIIATMFYFLPLTSGTFGH